MFGHFDPVLLFLIFGFMAIGWLVSRRMKSVFTEYSQVPILSGMTGKSVAEKMLRDNGIYDVKVISVEGALTDHYNPAEKTVNLSQDVYEGKSISSAAVAAHECGHAVQHANAYRWLDLRSKLIPIVNFSNNMLNIVYGAMFFLAFAANLYNQALLMIIALQTVITILPLVTLPVEIDASRRALVWLDSSNITPGEDHEKAATALKWAALTYVVAALASLTTLFYYIMRYLSNNRN
jgi:Zn-dependent membrane protease YugP